MAGILTKQTLLTGFGSFESVVSNPTERLVRHFEQQTVEGHALTTCVLPVSYRRAPEVFLEAFQRGGKDGQPFDTVLLMGIAGGSRHWRVEEFGRNRSAGIADCVGETASGCIEPDMPETLRVSIPVKAVAAAIEQAGLPAAVSKSAGGYLCNYILFMALSHIRRQNLPTRAGFLHVPNDEATFGEALSDEPCFSFEKQVTAVRAALSVLAVYRRRSRSAGG